MVCLLLITGCASSREEIPAPVAPPESFSDSGDATMPDKWWRAFDDDPLNQRVDRALGSNLDLRVAWQRLREARAVLDRESASLFPDLDANADAETRRGSERGSDTEQLQLGLSSSYEVDLWGRIGSRVDAERFRLQASYADYQTAALSLSAEVTRTWYRLMEERSQLELINNQIQTNRDVLRLIETRFGSGQTQSADVLRQRQLLESTREQKLTIESRIQVFEHQLAVLLGKPPRSAIDQAGRSLPELPPLPETGLPVELVQRRPDVRRAHNRLRAADAALAAAISNQYPRLTLNASVSTRENDANDLFDNWASAFAGNLVAPLIDAGQRDAEVARSRSIKQQRLFEYGQTILTAFQEVEDALIQEKKQRRRIESLEEQLRLADATYEQLRLEYFNGVTDYIDVLNTLTDRQELRRNLLSAELELLEFRIALYRALAGGFDTGRETGELSHNE
ncbi:efflux transporter outer membrane subunit [Halospina denitrificans]|uniref:efflux transporter outer membrane subunit n=1 Tax=Halospina denitrificans TaxID=332522 RepID=UPI0024445DDB|nr:efflux transporter outer membrane subunit [Halospina denitrificans]